jgi:phosphoglycolate phosphatase
VFEAVLFDLDGTLADTAPDLAAALNHLRREDGLQDLPLELLRPVASNGVRGLLGVGLGLGTDDPRYDDYARRFLDRYRTALCVATTLFDGVPALLDALEAREIPWGVVTNKQQRYTLPLLGQLGLAHRAACIVSGDSTPRPKPHPDPLLLACMTIDRQPAGCLYVGDDLRDVQAGRAAGMATVAALYGYLGNAEPVQEWGADHHIERPEDLLAVLDAGP